MNSLGGVLLICQNAKMQVRRAWIQYFRFMFKNIWHTWLAVLGPPLVRDGPLGAPAFLKLAYWANVDSLLTDTSL